MRPIIISEMRNARKLAFALSLAIAWPAAAGQTTAPVLVDADLTVGAGATVTAAAGEVLERLEDQVVPARLFAERGFTRRAVNVTYRFFKFMAFDAPQESWLVLANHEVMGHGARLRERFDGPIGYTFDAPPPFGDGGGSTFFGFDRDPTPYELLAVSAAGMEADAVSASLVASRAFIDRRMTPREALRYLQFELDTFSYVRSTGDDPEEPGHDVSDHLQIYNELAAATGGASITAKTLRREAFLGLANPMLGIAAYGIGQYLWNGRTDTRVPALTIGGVRYLPLMRYQLTPYGTEWALVNHLAGRRLPTRIDLRVGRASGGSPWAVGVERRGVGTWNAWRLDVGGDVWRQPRIADTSPDVITAPLRFGVEVRARGERPLMPVWFSAERASVIVDIAAKTDGFVPGEPLGPTIVLRAGVGLPR